MEKHISILYATLVITIHKHYSFANRTWTRICYQAHFSLDIFIADADLGGSSIHRHVQLLPRDIFLIADADLQNAWMRPVFSLGLHNCADSLLVFIADGESGGSTIHHHITDAS